MVIETNHPPKMMEALSKRQAKVDAGCAKHRLFFLETSNPKFGIRALNKLTSTGKVELIPIGSTGDCFCRLAQPDLAKKLG